MEFKKVGAQFFRYVLQSTLGMIGISVYILADTFFISVSAGADGITVLNLVLPLYGFIYAIGSMIGIGSATRYTIRRLSGNRSDHFFTHALIWQLMISVPFILLGILSPASYLHLMGGSSEITALGVDYTGIVLIGAPLFMTNYTFTAFARNDNAPSIAMIGSLSGSMFNILFDYIFMFPLGMGLKGAALATAMSPAVTIAVTLTHYFSKRSSIRLVRITPSPKRLFTCCKLGFSAFVGEISNAVTALVFNTILLTIVGNVGVAAYGIVANLSLVAVAIFSGIAQGVQPLLSAAFGRGNRKEIRELLVLGLIVTAALEIIILALSWIFTDPFIAVFNSENNLQMAEYAHTGLRLYFLGFSLAGINILLVNYFSAIAQAMEAFVASILRGMIAITLCALTLSFLLGINGVWLSFLASETITFIVIMIMMKKR